MRVVGLVTEYNPFHNGHLYHLQKAKELTGADYSIAVMSGHFLQRGEPALLNKWTRAEMAVSCGVDLVFELPYAFSCRSAGVFAHGAVSLLAATNLVTHLCFGSELGETEPLINLAQLFLKEPPEYQQLINEYLKTGLTLPSAQTKALVDYIKLNPSTGLNPEVLNNPNNILGIEYIRSLLSLQSNIIPIALQRIHSGYHDTGFSNNFASATSIREQLRNALDYSALERVMPKAAYELLVNEVTRRANPAHPQDFFSLIKYKLITSSAEELGEILDLSEGLENRLKSLMKKASGYIDLVESIKTKRYTWTRIQRVLNYIMMQYTKSTAQEFDLAGPQYLRLLACSEQGRRLLSHMRKRVTLPVITRVAPAYKKGSPVLQKMLDFDCRATDIYALCCEGAEPLAQGADYVLGPRIK